MKVETTNLVSFSRNINKSERREIDNETLSKKSVLDSLKLSKGREEKNAKFKKMEKGLNIVSDACAIALLSMTPFLVHKAATLGKEGLGVMLSTSGAKVATVLACIAMSCKTYASKLPLKNQLNADTTAHENGFLTEHEYFKMSKDERIKAINEQYDKHINSKANVEA